MKPDKAHLARVVLVALRTLAQVAGLASFTVHTAYALEQQHPGEKNFISRAAFDGQRLWLRSDAGVLSTVVPGETVLADAGLPEPALDVCANAGLVQALTCSRDACSTWTLRRKDEDRWTAVATVRAGKDDIAGLSCATGDRTVVLTSRRLIEVKSGSPVVKQLSAKIGTGTVTSVHVTKENVFVGINAGEWGGGLRRINRRTGPADVILVLTGINQRQSVSGNVPLLVPL